MKCMIVHKTMLRLFGSWAWQLCTGASWITQALLLCPPFCPFAFGCSFHVEAVRLNLTCEYRCELDHTGATAVFGQHSAQHAHNHGHLPGCHHCLDHLCAPPQQTAPGTRNCWTADCCSSSSNPRLPLQTEAPVVMSNGVFFLCLSCWTSVVNISIFLRKGQCNWAQIIALWLHRHRWVRTIWQKNSVFWLKTVCKALQ